MRAGVVVLQLGLGPAFGLLAVVRPLAWLGLRTRQGGGDSLFGSLYLPERPGWPDRYPIAGDPVPPDLAGQLAYPFRVSRGRP